MEKKNYIVAIDIGSSEVVIAVGSMAEGGVVNIEAIVAEHTEGMAAGLVDNSQMVAEALRTARQRAEELAGVAITDAYVVISGKFVRCARYTDHVFVAADDNCISQSDLAALRERMCNVKAADGETIMELFPLNYKGDAGNEMKNPVGCYSKQLSSTYNFILCENMAKERLRRVFLDAGIRVRKLYAGGAVIAESVVTSDEMEEGVAVVDMGSGVTDVAIYHGGVLCYMASIPMGGSALNADIRVYDGYIPPRIVENLKRKLGSAVVDLTPDEMIQMRSRSRSIKPISRLNLAAVIEARMTDIAEYVMAEIRDAGYAKKLGAGIVLTGGVADLKNVAELFHRVTGFETRTACAEVGVATESLEKVYSPNLTMAVSLLIRGARDGACPVGVYVPRPKAEPEEQPEQPRVVAGGSMPQPSVQQPPVQQPVVEQPVVEQQSATANNANLQDTVKEDEIDDIVNDAKEKKKGGWFSNIIKTFSGAFNEPTDNDDSEDSW